MIIISYFRAEEERKLREKEKQQKENELRV